MRTTLTLIALCTLVAAGCADDSPMGVPDGIAPQFGKPPAAAPKFGTTMADGAGHKVLSDGRAARILGVLTPRSYRDAECGVTASFSLADAVSDAAQKLTTTQKKTCVDGNTLPRNWKLVLDAPANAGDPTQGTAVSTHFKMDSVQTVTGSAQRWGSFAVATQDCDKIRFSGQHGSDLLLVTRTRDVSGADRNEWTVETAAIIDPVTGAVTGYRDLAICLKMVGGTLQPVRLYHVPFKMTITQVTY